MTIEYITGDATAPQGTGPKIIAHVVNDAGGWGAGFVLALSRHWREPERQYRSWFQSADSWRLGMVQYVAVEPEVIVANMLAQRGFAKGRDKIPLSYDALRACLGNLETHAKLIGASVHMPRIGSGLAGGAWPVIAAIIEDRLTVPVTVYDLPGSEQ